MPPENSQENPRFKKRRRRRKKQVAGKKRDQPTLALLQKKKRFGRYLDVPAWQRLAAPPHGLLRSYWNLMQAVKSYRSSLKWHVLFWCFSAKKKKRTSLCFKVLEKKNTIRFSTVSCSFGSKRVVMPTQSCIWTFGARGSLRSSAGWAPTTYPLIRSFYRGP